MYNVVYSSYKREGTTDNPWEANTLEWATSSPPPAHNFDPGSLPYVTSDRPLWDLRHGTGEQAPAQRH
jgi:cytochrome c oxidase subunit I